MKIIACAPIPPPHGGITNWYRIVKQEAKKVGIDLLTVDISPRTSKLDKGILYRIFIQGMFLIKQTRELKQTIKKHPEAKVAHLTSSGQLALIRDIVFLLIFKKQCIKSVYHLHYGRIPKVYLSKKWEWRLFAKAVSLTDAVVSIDPQTTEVLTTHFLNKKICYIPNPVEVVDKVEPSDKKKIAFIGMVVKHKGIEELLTSWNSIKKQHPDWELNIVGKYDDNYKCDLEKRFDMDRIKFWGLLKHKDAMEILEDCSFLVLPSYSEGFPNVILEAMMRERAVVATDVGAIKDILSNACGVVIPKKNNEELEGAICNLIENSDARKQMGRNGRNKAKQLYASNVVFLQYINLWKELKSGR